MWIAVVVFSACGVTKEPGLPQGEGSASTESESSSESGDGATRPPPGAAYGSCEPGLAEDPCDEGLRCILGPELSPGFCTTNCDTPADCLGLDGAAPPVCTPIDLSTEGSCALDCSTSECPTGMRCEAVMRSDGTQYLCF